MKNFFKSFAIFACAALLLGACTEEETTDLGESFVAAPDVVNIKPGNSRFQVTWRMSAEKFSDVDYVEIAYGTSKKTYSAAQGLVAGENTLIVDAKAQTYDDVTITAVDVNGKRSQTDSFGSVAPYDQATYSEYKSKFTSLEEPEPGSGVFFVTFEDLYDVVADEYVADLQAWHMSYFVEEDDDVTPTGVALIRYSSDVEGYVSTIDDARSGSHLLSVVTYYPDNYIGEEVDKIKVITDVTEDNDTSIPEVPAAPTAVTLTPIYTEGETVIDYTYALQVDWEIDPESKSYSYAKVSYTVDGSTTTLEEQFTDARSTKIDVNPNKEYTVEVQTYDRNNYTSATTSAIAEVSKVEVVTPANPTNLVLTKTFADDAETENSIINLSWTLSEDKENIMYTLVECGEAKFYVASEESSLTIPSLTEDEQYDIKVTTYNYGFKSLESLEQTVTTYNANSFDALLPEVAGLIVSGEVVVGWSGLDVALVSVDVTYNAESKSGVVESGVLKTENFTYADGVNKVTYTATFKPAGAAREVTIDGEPIELTAPDGDYEKVGDIYWIYNEKGLVYFADVVNGTNNYGSAEAPVQNASAGAKLMTTIDLSTVCSATLGNWTPIGSQAVPYTGVFDGANNKITNLYYSSEDAEAGIVGLFGRLSGATVQNLDLEVDYMNGYNYTGAIAGNVTDRSLIDRCNVTSVAAPSQSYNIYSSNATRGDRMGAIVGNLEGWSTISNCTNAAKVSTNVGEGANVGLGGIVGYADCAYINNCSNSADIAVDITKDICGVGGIVGFVATRVSVVDCTNSGDITASINVGGVVGAMNAGIGLTSQANTYSFVTGCSNSGVITGSYESKMNAASGVSDTNGVGGVVGATHKFGYIADCKNAGAVNGVNNTGGVLGYSNNYSAVVGCSNSAIIEGAYVVGGITGFANSYSSVVGGHNSGEVYGTLLVGGVVGSVFYDEVDLVGCYNVANVYVSDSANASNDAGGVLGHDWTKSSTVFSNCYFVTPADNTPSNSSYDAADAAVLVVGRLKASGTTMTNMLTCTAEELASEKVALMNTAIEDAITGSTSIPAAANYWNIGCSYDSSAALVTTVELKTVE